jgi:DNA-binding NarL/FixJ family response regulator
VIRAELPGTAIIVLSAHVEVEEAMELLVGGEGAGYLLKSRITDVAEFIETVGRIAAGGSVVDPSLVQELIKAPRRCAGGVPGGSRATAVFQLASMRRHFIPGTLIACRYGAC